MTFKIIDLIVFIKSYKTPSDSFNTKDYITFCSSSTRSSHWLKLQNFISNNRTISRLYSIAFGTPHPNCYIQYLQMLYSYYLSAQAVLLGRVHLSSWSWKYMHTSPIYVLVITVIYLGPDFILSNIQLFLVLSITYIPLAVRDQNCCYSTALYFNFFSPTYPFLFPPIHHSQCCKTIKSLRFVSYVIFLYHALNQYILFHTQLLSSVSHHDTYCHCIIVMIVQYYKTD